MLFIVTTPATAKIASAENNLSWKRLVPKIGIYDEVHKFIANKSQTAEALRKIQPKFVLAISATPISATRLSSLYQILQNVSRDSFFNLNEKGRGQKIFNAIRSSVKRPK